MAMSDEAEFLQDTRADTRREARLEGSLPNEPPNCSALRAKNEHFNADAF